MGMERDPDSRKEELDAGGLCVSSDGEPVS